MRIQNFKSLTQPQVHEKDIEDIEFHGPYRLTPLQTGHRHTHTHTDNGYFSVQTYSTRQQKPSGTKKNLKIFKKILDLKEREQTRLCQSLREISMDAKAKKKKKNQSGKN